MKTNKIIFVCDSRDYHAMDWYHTVKEICNTENVIVATDIVDYTNHNLVLKDDNVVKLFNINKFLFNSQSRLLDFWRNIVKLASTFLQVYKLKKLSKVHPNSIFHAHSMYYIFLCWLARLKFIATPMGSDVLVRPDQSVLYKFMTCHALKFAYIITVDSVSMKNKVLELSGKESIIIQNGIDVRLINTYLNRSLVRNNIVSIRGFYSNYQIDRIIESRYLSKLDIGISFVYPFFDINYRDQILKKFTNLDNFNNIEMESYATVHPSQESNKTNKICDDEKKPSADYYNIPKQCEINVSCGVNKSDVIGYDADFTYGSIN